MALPDGMNDTELIKNGYVAGTDGHAKHNRYSSYRHRCKTCGRWYKQLQNGKCKSCRKS
jgi:rRNA maturation endonuclease Nob1